MMRKRNLFLLFAFIVAAPFLVLGQDEKLRFEQITTVDGLPQSTIHGIAKDKYGFMWFGTWNGLCRYDGYSFRIYTYNPKDKKSINNNRIHNIVKDKDQNIWIRTFDSEELCRYNYEKDNFDRIPSSRLSAAFLALTNRRKHVEALNVDFKEYRWNINLRNNRLVETNKNNGQTKVYVNSLANPRSINDAYVTDLYKDNHNVFWVGTFSSGINKANLNLKPFGHFYHNPLNPKSIADNNVRAVCEDKAGNLWVGTRDKGITVIGRQGYKHIRAGEGNTISDDQIRSIYCDSKGIVWIGSKEGLNSYNPSSGKFTNFANNGLGGVSVFGMMEDKEQNMLFATWNGVYKYNAHLQKLIHFDVPSSVLDRFSRVIMQDKSGHIWVGAEGDGGRRGGITVLKPVAGKESFEVIRHFIHEPDGNSLSDNRIYCIYEDQKGMIWIGTGNGLDRFDPEKNTFTHITASSGLPGSSIAAIIEDENGNLWVSHKKGISQLDRKTLQVRNYTEQDGLQGNEFSDGAVYKRKSENKLFFGGNNGFNVFNPDSILPERTLPNTVLTQLQILNHRVGVNEEINGRRVLTKPLYLTKSIQLTAGDKSVAIEFAGLHYSNPQGNKYAYKLEGFDKDWVYTDASRRLASYSNLSPGNYTFNVISSNSDGVWNTKPAVLNIEVLPPFWASSWAYIFYAILILGLLYIYHYYSTKFARLKSKIAYDTLIHERENELHQSKLQFFTNISHEIKTPLTLILAPLERLMQMFADNKIIYEQLSTMKLSSDRLLKLVTQLLDFRRLETGNLAPDFQIHDIIGFLARTLHSFEDAARAKNVQLNFLHDVDSCSFPYDEDKLEKVICNLLSNALKFTRNGGWIKVKFGFDNQDGRQFAVISVANLGTAVSEEEKELIFQPFKQASLTNAGGTGLGLAYSKGLVELHGGSISVSGLKLDENESETTFRVELPLKQDVTQLAAEHEELVLPGNEQSVEPLSLSSFRVGGSADEEKVLINGRTPLLLLVEDDTDLRAYLKNYFEHYYEVVDAVNGKDGLKLASEHLPDLIISDVMMDEMDGFDFCRSIKSDAKTSHIPLILLTAKTPVEAELEGIETGADDYLTKPFNLRVLTARVRNLLFSRNALKQKYRREISLHPAVDSPMSADEKMLQRLLEFVEQHISDPDLGVELICSGVGVSKTQLYRKLKELTGLSLLDVIKEIRLKKARQLLREEKFTVNEIAYMVGFSDADYFRRCFKSEFSMTPTEYVKSSLLPEK